MEPFEIRRLEERDVGQIVAAFGSLGWDKPRSQYERYLSEQREGTRIALVASRGGTFAGYVTINWRSGYPPFREKGIPEIQDLNVLPRFRREGMGTRLMDEAERTAAERSDVVGLGVGLSGDYGAAQRLYVLRGYVPDGRGLIRNGPEILPGDVVTVDDSLVLFLSREI